ncbi:MAG: alkaline phosphatase family protein [Verrucomicrobia bacterium]|nr:alkaline phosphatase family protein [Verrucomicrobiota bacterium]
MSQMRTAVLNVVGLTDRCLGPHTPRITAHVHANRRLRIDPALPAVTCTAQSTYLTGLPPGGHGAVANGWYDRQLAEVQFWKQSNRLIQGPRLWEVLKARNPGFTCAKLFWWYNMFSTADYSITPRPMYPADGRKVFDIYSWPYSIRPAIKADLGEFPFPGFWGPAAGKASPAGGRDCATRWIAESAKWIDTRHSPSLSLLYLPHLDYNLQRLGPSHPDTAQDLREIDAIVGDLLDFFSKRGVQVVLLSEYGLVDANQPVHLNRAFREQGWLTVKEELGLELLDAGASKAFAVADHQAAHVYVQDPGLRSKVHALLEQTTGVGRVLDRSAQIEQGLHHDRSGDFLVFAAKGSWFTYYYWLDDARAPDFARCVDIHRKPGYDPAELFINPDIPLPKLRIAMKLLRKKLGFRMLMDLIPLDARLVRGTHGARPEDPLDFPILCLPEKGESPLAPLSATDVFGHLVRVTESAGFIGPG